MSRQPLPPDDDFAARLEACEAALNTGSDGGLVKPPNLTESAELDARLKRGLDCVKRLKKHFPGQSSVIREEGRPRDKSRPTSNSKDGQAESLLAWGETPGSIGRFLILRELGRGGYGVVFLARDPVLDRDIALKLPRADVLVDPKLRERFALEARAAAALDHPHLVQVFEAGNIGPVCYIAAAYCPGESLAQWLKRQNDLTSPAEAANLIATLADAVEHAHQNGVLHRDLKPANVLLSPKNAMTATRLSDFVAKITDFGLAKMTLSDVISQTHSGSILGTPAYMAPEQASGKGKEITFAADIYALGAMLYELMSGRPPFQGDSPLDMLDQVRNAEPASLSKLRWKTPRDLETICLKCLEKDPARRYARAQDLADDLRRFIDGKTIRARPASSCERAIKWAKRKPAIAGLLAAISLVALMGFAGVTWQWLRADWALSHLTVAFEEKQSALLQKESALKAMNTALGEKDVALREKQTALMGQIQALQEKNLALAEEERQRNEAQESLSALLVASAHREWLASNPDAASQLLKQIPVTQRHWEWNYLNRLSQSEVLTMRGHTMSVLSLAVSRDGKRFASSAGFWGTMQPGELSVWDAVSGTLLWTMVTPTPYYKLTFTHDGSQVITASNLGAQFWDVATRQEVKVLREPTGGATDVAVSPDGTSLAIGGSNGNQSRVMVWNLRDGTKQHDFTGHSQFVTCVAFSANGQRLASCSRDGTARIWELTNKSADAKSKPLILSGPLDIRSIEFSPDEKLIATSSWDRTAKVWDAVSGELLQHYREHEAPVVTLAFTPDGSAVATGDISGRVRIWEPLTGITINTLRAHAGSLNQLKLLDSGRLMVTSGEDCVLRLWDIDCDQQFQRELPFTRGYRSLAIRPDGRWSACGEENNVWLTDLSQPASSPRNMLLTEHRDTVNAVRFSDDSQWLASACRDKKVRLWQAPKRNVSGPVASKLGAQPFLELSRQAQELFTFLDPQGPPAKMIRELTGHTESVLDVVFQQESHVVISGSADKTVRMWNADTGRQLRILNGHNAAVLKVAAETQLLASIDLAGTLILWNAADGREVGRTSGGGALFCSGLEFSRRGRWLAATDAKHQIRVWDVRRLKEQLATSGKVNFESAQIANLSGHLGAVTSLAFSADGRRIVSSSRDATVRVWDLPQGHPLIILRPESHAYAATFTPDETALLTASTMIQRWDGTNPTAENRAIRRRTISADASRWHSLQVERFAGRKQWSAADYHLTALINSLAPPKSAFLFARRGEVRAELGRLEDAATDFSRHLEQQPDDSLRIYYRALLALHAEDRVEYERQCEIAIGKFAETSNPAVANIVGWTCTLGSLQQNNSALAIGSAAQVEVSLARRQAGLRFSERALSKSPAAQHYLMNHGIAAFRAGQDSDAIEILQRSLAIPSPHDRAEVFLVLALAYQHLGNSEQAEAWNTRWKEAFARHINQPIEGDLNYRLPWTSRLRLEIFQREAAALVQTPTP